MPLREGHSDKVRSEELLQFILRAVSLARARVYGAQSAPEDMSLLLRLTDQIWQ